MLSTLSPSLSSGQVRGHRDTRQVAPPRSCRTSHVELALVAPVAAFLSGRAWAWDSELDGQAFTSGNGVQSQVLPANKRKYLQSSFQSMTEMNPTICYLAWWV
jgi:hypothetical protein